MNNSDQKTPHYVFIGRWNPLHKGHVAIIKKKLEEKNRPVLILVRDTAYDELTALQRALIVEEWMLHENIKGRVIIIPDIDGVYYGRGVGYNIEMVEVDDEIKAISATEIRKMIKKGDETWEEIVAPGTVNLVEKYLSNLGQMILRREK